MQYKLAALFLLFTYNFGYHLMAAETDEPVLLEALESEDEDNEITLQNKPSALQKQFNQGEMPDSYFLQFQRGCSVYEEFGENKHKIGSFNIIFYKNKFPGSYDAYREAKNEEVRSMLWKGALPFTMKNFVLEAENNDTKYSVRKELGGYMMLIKINVNQARSIFAICDGYVRTYLPSFIKNPMKTT